MELFSLMLSGRTFQREGGTYLKARWPYRLVLESLGLGTSVLVYSQTQHCAPTITSAKTVIWGEREREREGERERERERERENPIEKAVKSSSLERERERERESNTIIVLKLFLYVCGIYGIYILTVLSLRCNYVRQVSNTQGLFLGVSVQYKEYFLVLVH